MITTKMVTTKLITTFLIIGIRIFQLQTTASANEAVELILQPPLKQLRIYNSAGPGVEVAVLQAKWSQKGFDSIGSKIRFELVNESDAHLFEVDHLSGRITTREKIDGPVGTVYSIVILARGEKSINHTSSVNCTLSIVVSEYNQFGPEFEQTIYYAKAYYLSSTGTKVVQVKATDRDEISYNSEINYYTSPSMSHDSPFVIDAVTGQIVISRSIPNTSYSFLFDVFAKDNGSPVRINKTIVKIEITKLSEIVSPAPIISSIIVFHQTTTARVCWSMTEDIEKVMGYHVIYHFLQDQHQKPTEIIIHSSKKNDCTRIFDILINSTYKIEIYAWNEIGNGLKTSFVKRMTEDSCKCGDNGICRSDNDNDEDTCICKSGFFGDLCQFYNPCRTQWCSNGGRCVSRFASNQLWTFLCDCPPGFRGTFCQHSIKCKFETTKTINGQLEWRPINHGRVRIVECSTNNRSFMQRKCLLGDDGQAHWGSVDDRNCSDKPERIEKRRQSVGMNADEMAKVIKEFNSINLNNEVDKIASEMKEFVEVAGLNLTLTDQFLSVVDNLTNRQKKEMKEWSLKTAQSLILMVDELLSSVKLENKEYHYHNSDHLEVKVVETTKKPAATLEKDISFVANVTPPDLAPAIRLPAEAIVKSKRKTNKTEIRIKFVAFSDQRLFTKRLKHQKLDIPVLQVAIENVSIDNLLNSVTYTFPKNYYNDNATTKVTCVYWDVDSQDWSTKGISTKIDQEKDTIVCKSNHLTAFSILYDFNPSNDPIALGLTIITYLGCYLSITGLFLTILTYSMFRCLNRDHSGQILIHLSISLLAMNLAFVSGSKKEVSFVGFVENSCTIVAILIHYFVLTSLSWMCVEAIHIYQLLIRIFSSTETHFMLKRTSIAWGLPLVWTFLSVYYKPQAYSNKNVYCMMSFEYREAYYIFYLIPATVLILINFTIFVITTRVLFTPRMIESANCRSNNSGRVRVSQVRGAFTVMTLLGVGWVFGAFAIGHMKTVFQYLFCLTNSLQGLFIFIIRCIQYPEARNAWLQFFKTGTLRKHRGQSQLKYGSWSGNSNFSHKSSDKKAIGSESESSSSVHLTMHRKLTGDFTEFGNNERLLRTFQTSFVNPNSKRSSIGCQTFE